MNKAEFSKRILASQDRLYHITIAIVSREAGAEDATQESLMKAWRSLGSLHDDHYFETWLTRILINECRRILRARAKRPTCEVPDTPPAPTPPDPLLRDALNRLDVKYRLPIVLHHAEGYTLDETARMLRLPVGAVKWRIQKGSALLRSMLTDGEVEHEIF